MQNHPHSRQHWRLFGLLLVCSVLALAGCSREERDETRPAEELYADAKAALDGRNYSTAIDRYRRLTTLYPFGRHAEQAQLDMAYAMQQGRRPEDALTTLDRFIRTYPTHPNIDYAWYLKGLVHYDEAMGMLRRLFPGQVVDRDQESARRAFQDFQELIQRYPQSRYVADARQRMVFLRNVLAEYEITVAEYYFRRQAYIASINRARYVIENYPGAPANVNALDVLQRAYQKLDLPDLAEDTRRVLELNYSDQLQQMRDSQPGFLRRLWPFD
ncbi:outer membrane protein assembly factor BamD [Wenzhouxiangella marina]|uniref:Outer membrane protein assembly factor BamD n=2 Tax=Wenzhouxiangella marina TaxID=1579979 RepID=A0A0K0XSX6_9GAMM|nr:outer membrane protein assembly factor BamD [Wenzhouxiangella marina]AKS40788.1 competence protein ComL [Wenzhouxiangella marina]